MAFHPEAEKVMFYQVYRLAMTLHCGMPSGDGDLNDEEAEPWDQGHHNIHSVTVMPATQLPVSLTESFTALPVPLTETVAAGAGAKCARARSFHFPDPHITLESPTIVCEVTVGS